MPISAPNIIAENSAATPGLWNSIVTRLWANDQALSTGAFSSNTLNPESGNTIYATCSMFSTGDLRTATFYPATVSGTPTWAATQSMSISGNAATATIWATGRTVSITGDLAYTSGSLNGSANVTGTGTLATVNANVGSFGSSTSIPSFTVNGKGLITAASGNAVVAPAGTLTGDTLAANVLTSSLTTIGTLVAGAVPASLVTAATFPAGTYVLTTRLDITGSAGTRSIQIRNGGIIAWYDSANTETARIQTSGTGGTLNVNTLTTLTVGSVFSLTASSGNITVGTINSGTITSGAINGQTISAAASFTGTLDTVGTITATTGSGTRAFKAAGGAFFSWYDAVPNEIVRVQAAAGVFFMGLQNAGNSMEVRASDGNPIATFADTNKLSTFGGGIVTSAPTGGAGTWELGIANSVSPTAPNRTVTIEIGGTAYYLHAKTTND